MITTEVESCWTALKVKTNCRSCGSLLMRVPKTWHFNSHYWKLHRHNKEQLMCCPKGCSVKLAEEKMREFLGLQFYCTKDSKSWNWTLDYTIIKNAWINRRGQVYPLENREHSSFAINRDLTERDLELKGWLKLSIKTFMWQRRLSKLQIDFCMDYLIANKLDKYTRLFMEESISRSNYFNCFN